MDYGFLTEANGEDGETERGQGSSLADSGRRSWGGNLMNIVQHAAGNADDQHLEVAPGAVLHPARHIDNYAFGESDPGVIKLHAALRSEERRVGKESRCRG